MKKYSFLQLVLTVTFIASLMISNVIAGRQFLLPGGFAMTGAVIIFPIVYILSDVFSEVYGYKRSRITCYLGFGCNLLMSLVFMLVISLKAPDFFTGAEAYSTVLGSTPRLLFASLFAYVVGDFVNDRIFKKMKDKHKNDNKGFGLRAIISSLFGEIIDSGLYIPLAFIGTMPASTLLTMIVLQVSLKIAYEIVILPLTTLIVKKVQAHENNLVLNK